STERSRRSPWKGPTRSRSRRRSRNTTPPDEPRTASAQPRWYAALAVGHLAVPCGECHEKTGCLCRRCCSCDPGLRLEREGPPGHRPPGLASAQRGTARQGPGPAEEAPALRRIPDYEKARRLQRG